MGVIATWGTLADQFGKLIHIGYEEKRCPTASQIPDNDVFTDIRISGSYSSNQLFELSSAYRAALPTISVSPTVTSKTSGSQSFTVYITASNYTSLTFSSSQSWAAALITLGTSPYATVTISQNTNLASRSAVITFYATNSTGTSSATCTINQAGGSSSSTMYFKASASGSQIDSMSVISGRTVSFYVTSDQTWKISYLSTIGVTVNTFTPTSGSSTSATRISFKATLDSADSPASVTVHLRNSSGTVKAALSIEVTGLSIL